MCKKHQSDYLINNLNLVDIGCEYLEGKITYEECVEKMMERMDKAYQEGVDKLKAKPNTYFDMLVDVKEVK